MAEKTARPLSPHLQVYRWELHMLMSILHRASGAALALGTLLALWMLLSAAIGPEAYGHFTTFCRSPLGQFMLFGWSVALFYHLCNGVRHLIWDTVHLFEIRNAYLSGLLVLGLTAFLTALLWGPLWFGW